ncbi:MAG TPA: FIST C-terminal domain-containing protein [Quisquiliibacterium sp.]|nr:FIST C-terminal domain-containing protein [Quisquiliibacterium sp.]HQP65918.1 FIST C-terminal domain-containing protein [Quisquiliibacterium sp.]
MKVIHSMMPRDAGVPEALGQCIALDPQLVLVFGALERFSDPAFHGRLRALFPAATLVGCSTAGEICGDGVEDGSVQLTAIRFRRAAPAYAQTLLQGPDDSFAAGARLGAQLRPCRPGNALVFGPGVGINGSALIDGIGAEAGRQMRLSGGLAGGGGGFERTMVLGNDAVSEQLVVAVGFDDALDVTYGCFGGWRPFGPRRRVTRASGSVLYALDGAPALEVYRRYLGEYAKDLPAAGLLFPFEMSSGDGTGGGLIRTILGIDEEQGALLLAGDIDPDGSLQLMQASTDALVDGAYEAARQAGRPADDGADALVLLVSCVGRKLVMGARVDEEIDAVREIFGGRAVLSGFYSHGEISPYVGAPECALHNQTMAVTCLQEPHALEDA